MLADLLKEEKNKDILIALICIVHPSLLKSQYVTQKKTPNNIYQHIKSVSSFLIYIIG